LLYQDTKTLLISSLSTYLSSWVIISSTAKQAPFLRQLLTAILKLI
jgi:hypothetical protein